MKKISFFALMCMIVSLTGCDKIKDATSKEFKVNGVKFAFSAESKAGTAMLSTDALSLRAATTQSFTVTRTVDISEMGSDEVIEFANKINNVAINNALIQITTVPAGIYNFEDITVTAAGVPGQIVISSYTIGNTVTFTPDMNAFTSAFIMKLISNKSASATVKGKTDAPAGTIINISYESDLILTASII